MAADASHVVIYSVKADPHSGAMSPKKFFAVAVAVISVFTIVSVAVISTQSSSKTVPQGQPSVTNNLNGLSLSAGYYFNSPNGVNYTLGVTVEIYNTRPFSNNVSTSDQWPLSSLSAGPCSNWPAGIALYSGFLNRASVSTAQPLEWFPVGIYACPVIYNIKAYLFHPMSNFANPYPSYGPGGPMIKAFPISQLWVQGPNGQTHHSLQAGRYTLVVGDEWGQMLLFNFTIY